MSGHAKVCPRCGSTILKSNGGTDRQTGIHGATEGLKGIVHHNPLVTAIGVGTLVLRMVNPLRYTCHNGHTF